MIAAVITYILVGLQFQIKWTQNNIDMVEYLENNEKFTKE